MSAASTTSPFDPRTSMSSLQRTGIMTALVVVTLMAALDSSFVPLAAADMIDKLDTSTSRVVWVVLGYLIAATGPMIFLSRLSETIGQIRLFQIGTALYSVAMVACAWAPDVFWLIVLRMIQGLGMALFLPGTFAIASQIYPSSHIGRALGILQAANAAGFVLGPLFGGWLLDAFDWRALFWARIPLGVVAVLLALAAFGVTRRSFVALKERDYFDMTGAVLLTMALFGLLFGANRLPVEDNHLEATVWMVFLGGFAAFALFLRQERQSPDPLVDLSLYKNSRMFTKASIAFTAMFASFPVYLFVLPLLLIAGLEMPAWDVGMILASGSLMTQIISPFAGRWGDIYGAELMSFVGTVLVAVGYLLLLAIDVNTPTWYFFVPVMVMGVGNGLFFAPNNSLIMSSVPPERASMASGMIGTLRQAGYAMGFAIIASLVTAVQDNYEASLTYFSIGVLDPDAARTAAELFDNGSIWSPEILVYIFRITVVICTAVLIWPLVTTIPKLALRAGHLVATSASAVVAAVIGTVLFIGMSELTPAGASIETARSLWRTYDAVEAFGWASRSVTVERAAYTGDIDPLTAYIDNCSACHGDGAAGIEDLGVALTDNPFVTGLSDDALKQFLITGRMEDSPDSKMGLMMPSFDYLEDEELDAIVAYLRQINRP